MRKIQLAGLSFLILFGAMELGVRLLPKKSAPTLFDMSLAPSTQAQPWYSAYLKDHDQLKRNFRAYEIYGLEPFEGEWINTDQFGFRKSWGEPKAPFEIGMFGGSTLWGSLSRDSHTIVSSANRVLGERARARNFAEVGFVFSQEFHRAQRLLYSQRKMGQASQVMVFFDGVNDSMSALTNLAKGVQGPAGLPWEFEKYRHLFQLGKTGEVSWGDVLRKSKLIRTLDRVAINRGWKARSDSKGIWNLPSEKEKEALAQQVALQYLDIVKSAHRSLSAQGVTPVFVLQPILPFKKSPTKEEADLLQKNGGWVNYFSETFAAISERSRWLSKDVQFWDLSRLFENEEGQMFGDVIHYNEAGNKRIGKEIAKRLLPLIKEEKKRVDSLS